MTTVNHLRNLLQVLYDSCLYYLKVIVLLTCCWPFCRGKFQILHTASRNRFYDLFEVRPPYIFKRNASGASIGATSCFEGLDWDIRRWFS